MDSIQQHHFCPNDVVKFKIMQLKKRLLISLQTRGLILILRTDRLINLSSLKLTLIRLDYVVTSVYLPRTDTLSLISFSNRNVPSSTTIPHPCSPVIANLYRYYLFCCLHDIHISTMNDVSIALYTLYWLFIK